MFQKRNMLKADRLIFIHKMKIASKEASESIIGFRLRKDEQFSNFNMNLSDELKQIIAIISKIIISAKKIIADG